MKKVRGCFVTILVIFVLVVVIFLIVSFFNQNDRNILLLGIDEREDSSDFVGLTDTIIVYHNSGPGKKNSLISIPRDIRVNLEGHGWNKINAAYKFGGYEMIKDEIYKLTDIRINKVMVANFRGFKEIIDILGGVNIEVEESLHDPLSGANFDPGTYNMDGEQALSFVRCRSTAGADLDRVDRQKYLLSELIKQKLNFQTALKSPQIIKALNEETVSDFTIWDFGSVGIMLLFSDKDVNWVTIPVEAANIEGISYLIADENEVKDFLNDYLE